MESVINIVDGDQFDESICCFCDSKASTVFGVVDTAKKRYNGYHMRGFHVCPKHLKALNSLLDGTKDIDKLVKNYNNIMTGRSINLRA